MLSRASWSIRVAIPAIISLVFLVLLTGLSLHYWQDTYRESLAASIHTNTHEFIDLQEHVLARLQRGDVSRLGNLFIRHDSDSNLRRIALLSPNARVRFSDDPGLIGQTFAANDSELTQALQTALHQSALQSLRRGDSLTLIEPVQAPSGDATNILVGEVDLRPAISNAWRVALRSIGLFWIAGLIILAILLLLLQRLVVRPLSLLEERARQMAEGRAPPPGEIPMLRELSHLMERLDAMHAQASNSMQAVQRSERHYRQLFDLAHEGIWVMDWRGVTQMVNQSMASMLDQTAEEMVGRHLYDFLDDAGIEQVKGMYQRGGESVHQDIRVYDRHRRCHRTLVSTRAIYDEEGRYSATIASVLDLTERYAAEEQVRQHAYYDVLTGLANRTLLFEELEQELARAQRHSHQDALFYIDLDQFKDINDSLGHDIGDRLLQEVARRIQSMIRREDSLARIGGDEFVLMVCEIGPDDDQLSTRIQTVAQNILGALRQPFRIDANTLHISASIGIALFPRSAQTPNDIFKQADTALYQAKRGGRNRIAFFSSEMQEQATERLSMVNRMQRALRENHFSLYYQPQYDSDEHLIGAEALIRWQDPELGPISPARFIPVAEDTGLIIDIGNWVIEEALSTLSRWLERGMPTHFNRLAINISTQQFQTDHFAGDLISACRRHRVPHHCLELEITESIFIERADQALHQIQKLKLAGFRFALDDFGTGYASLSYLKRLPLDKLKIDQSFVRDIDTDVSDASIVESIIAIASLFRLSVIAEGVETPRQLQFLKEHGCVLYQGYHFSPPVPLVDFERFLYPTERSSSKPSRSS